MQATMRAFYAVPYLLALAVAEEAHNGHNKPAPVQNGVLEPMLNSIIERQQGLAVNASVKTSVIEIGLLLLGIRETLQHLQLEPSISDNYTAYSESVMSHIIPNLSNTTADDTAPLDEFSVGSQFILEYV